MKGPMYCLGARYGSHGFHLRPSTLRALLQTNSDSEARYRARNLVLLNNMRLHDDRLRGWPVPRSTIASLS